MKDKFQIIVYAVFLVLMASLFRYYSGPFYYGNNNDPSYIYLYNFLYILEGKSLQFVDHPGTTLDLLGAGVVKMFFAPLPNTPWLLTNSAQAEEVLEVVWLLMTATYAVTFIILGLYALKNSREGIFTGLVLLSSLWLIRVRSFDAPGILPISANVNSDTLMMTAVNLMLLAILRFYFFPRTPSVSHAFSLGAAAAFAIATKLTALPFLVVAFFILESWRQRALLVIVAAGGFILLTCPIWSSYPRMMTWIKTLIFYKGLHGSGGEGFDGSMYLQAFLGVVKRNWFFVAWWLLAVMIALMGKPRAEPKIRRILSAVAWGGLAQLVIVSKQSSNHYMAPMIGLSSLVLAFSYKVFPTWWQKGLKYVVFIILGLSLGLISLNLWQVHNTTQKTKEMLDAISGEYAQCQVCPFYRSSMPGFGFVFWNNWLNREDYSAILKKQYPQMAYYDTFAKDFKDSARQIVPLAKLKQQRPCVLLYGSDQEAQGFEPNLTVKKIYTNQGSEALYEVISQRSNRGLQYLQYAMIMFSQGNDQEAFRAAMASQYYGVGQDISGFIKTLRQKIHPP